MNAEKPAHPTVLISYSHDSPEHEQRVVEVCNRLRSRGIDTFVDQFLAGAPAEGWPLWMERQIERCDFTIMICTEAYHRRFMEDEVSGIGRGVIWEARILRNLLYDDSERYDRIVPVLFNADARRFVPTVFRDHYYDVGDDNGFESLVRHLLREPGAEAGALGPLGPKGARWSAFERPWLVPDAMRTHYFTGREELIFLLHSQLVGRRRAVLSGLGGVGKTQAAIEYAVRHRADYLDGVFWINADSVGSLTAGFVEIAQTLHLAAADDSDQERIVAAVHQWFNNTDRWLLILDNVNNREEVRPFVPTSVKGHLLITSRNSIFQELGIARALEVIDLDNDEALRFLLTRTGRLDASCADVRTAATLTIELGCFPLALEQAGAYITETHADFSAYLAAFRKRRLLLIDKAASLVSHDTVSVTWLANFEAVQSESLAAADVLRTSAFLAPDAIPFDIFLSGAAALGDNIVDALKDADDLAMAEMLRPLARFSLIRSDPTSRTFSIHRLVQEVTRESVSESERERLVERVVSALDAIFPSVDYATWVQCERLVPHVSSIAGWIGSSVVQPERIGRVLSSAGEYLGERGRYFEAQSLLEKALTICENELGPEHPYIARSLASLGRLHREQARYAEAQPLFERALLISEKALGLDHPDVALCLNELALVHRDQGRYAVAKPLCKRALAILEKQLGLHHPNVADSLNNLALLHYDHGDYEEARPLHARALAIREKVLGTEHPHVAYSLNNLGMVYRNQGRYADAQPLFERAVKLRENTLGPDHPDVALSVNNLAALYRDQGRYDEARPLYERALAIWRKTLGSEHPHVAYIFHNLGGLHRSQGLYAEAQHFYERALSIREKALGSEHINVAHTLNNLAMVYREQGRYAEARPLAERALQIRKTTFGLSHPDYAESLNEMAELDSQQGHYVEAELLYENALAIRVKTLGPTHADVVLTILGLATLRVKQGRVSEAAGLFKRALIIAEQAFAVDHPKHMEIERAINALGTIS